MAQITLIISSALIGASIFMLTFNAPAAIFAGCGVVNFGCFILTKDCK